MLLLPFDTSIEIGVDEVGRGCLLGPVVAVAVALPKADVIQKDDLWKEIKDSKKLGEKKRYKLYEFLTKNSIAYGVGIISEKEIDEINILRATMKAMHKAIDECIRRLKVVKSLHTHCIQIKVDGPHFKPYIPPGEEDEWSIDTQCVVNGDATHLSIASASVIAKCVRDTHMVELVKQYPDLDRYGISKNKGYGTSVHMEALKAHGITDHHRKSFKPVRDAMSTDTTIHENYEEEQ